MRLPALNRPLSKHHEFNAAMVLVGCEGWAANGGPAKTNFCPLINYNHPGDVYYVQHPQVKDGKLYYLSFGPGQFLLPYYTGKALGIPYTPLLLQLINLLGHLISAWLVYRIALLLSAYKTDVPAKVATLFFLFSAETLWFFGNGYVHESVVMPFFAAALYMALKFFNDQNTITAKNLLLFGLIIFTGIFFDWLMVFFAAGVGAVALARMLKQRTAYLQLFTVTALFAIAATGLIVWLYCSFYGADRFWSLLMNKYENRNGLSGDAGATGTGIFASIARHFATGYLPLILLLIAGAFVYLSKRIAITQTMKLFLWLHIPVLIYFLVFASFSAEHDYSVLKFSIIIAVLAAYSITRLFTKTNVQFAFAIAAIALNIALYYYINPPGRKGFNGDEYALEKNAGELIRQYAAPDELVFHNMQNMNWPAVYYYSKRNNLFMPDADSAYRYLLTTPAKKMVFVDVAGKSVIKKGKP